MICLNIIIHCYIDIDIALEVHLLLWSDAKCYKMEK